MTTPYDPEALWMKAKLFVNRAMDDDQHRSFDEQALWAALALELLAKAALARFSPVLIAEPNAAGSNLLIASGLVRGEARFTSVGASTLFKRCQAAFRPFSQKEASAITSARNDYLHGATMGFTVIPPKAWWPRFWAQAEILVSNMDRDIENLVGPSRAATVKAHLAQNTKNIEHRTETLIERAKQRLAQNETGALPAKIAAEFKPGFDNSAGLRYRGAETCPACGGAGLVEGDELQDTQVEWPEISEDGYDYSAEVTLTVWADYFSCPECQLVLNEADLIGQAGLAVMFDVEGTEEDLPDYEPDYGND